MIISQRPSALGSDDDNDLIEEIFGIPKRFATFKSSYSDDEEEDEYVNDHHNIVNNNTYNDDFNFNVKQNRNQSKQQNPLLLQPKTRTRLVHSTSQSGLEVNSNILGSTASTSSHNHNSRKKHQQHRYSISSGLSELPKYTALAIKEASTAELSNMMMRSPSSSSSTANGAKYNHHKKSNSITSYGTMGVVPTEANELLSSNNKTENYSVDDIDTDDDSSSKADSSITVEEKTPSPSKSTPRKQAANTFGNSNSKHTAMQTEIKALTLNNPESLMSTSAISSTISNNGTTMIQSTHSIPSTMNYLSNVSTNQSINNL